MQRTFLVVLLSCAVLSSCSDAGSAESPRAKGPIRFGGTVGALCLPSARSGDYTFGYDDVQVTGSQPVIITRVALNGSHGVTMKEAYLVDISNTTLVGALPGWPPPGLAQTVKWRDKVSAVGSRLTEHAGPKNLVLHLTSTAGEGFDSVGLDYRSAGESYRVSTAVAVSFQAHC